MTNKEGQMNGDRVERLLTLKEVAEILRLSVRTVWRLIDKKDLPQPVRVGRSVRLFLSDVLTYLERLRERRGTVQGAN